MREWAAVFMGRSMREFNQFLRVAGISMPQIMALLRVHYHGPCGVSDVADHLDVSKAAASQLVDRLVQQGLLSRWEHPADRRVKLVALTEDGADLVAQGIEARQRWMEELTAVLSPQEQEDISAVLGRLSEAARQLEAGLPGKAGLAAIPEPSRSETPEKP